MSGRRWGWLRRHGGAPWLVVAAVVGTLALLSSSSAQPLPPIGRTPTPAPSTPPPSTPAPAPSTPAPSAQPSSPPATPTPTPTSRLPELPTPTDRPLDPGATPEPSDDPSSTPGTPALDPAADPSADLAGPHTPRGPRTPGRNTIKLVRILEEATRVGVPLEQALIEGMGRFPVAGIAWWSDDWHAPRFGPGPLLRLHKGLDIFADFGTPVRAPDDGVITRLSLGQLGGISAWMSATDGTRYYFAHLQGYAPDISEGTRVSAGTVIGYVGDTGNARGGAPHLHFEVHRPIAIPPKPYVDAWLDEAIEFAQEWVDGLLADAGLERQALRAEHGAGGLAAAQGVTPQATPEYSILLTLIDPVAGSVGVLPRLPLLPANSQVTSTGLLREIIRMRVDGSILGLIATGYDPRLVTELH